MVEPASDEAAAPEGDEQGDASDHGRHHHGDRPQRPDEPATGEWPPRQQPGHREPEPDARSEEHTSELPSPMRISHAVFCLKKNKPARTTPRSLATHTHLPITQ